jgi:hypothetical protein
MALIKYMTFPIMGMVAKKELGQISTIIGRYLGNDKKEKFLTACDDFDVKIINDLLDKTIEALTGESSVHYGMIEFIDKFPTLKDEMKKELTQYHFEYEQTTVFDKYYDQIIKLIKKG